MNINFVQYRKIYFLFSGIIILAGIFSLLFFGLKLGIDFTGGSILEIEYVNNRPSNQEIREKLKDFNLGDFSIQPTGEKGVILRMKDINQETHQKIIEKLGEIKELRFESIGPTIGKELKEKTKVVIIFSLLAILLYIIFAFSRVSRPIKSWQYGIVSILILSHDLLMPLFVFSLLGKYYGVQVTIPVIVALLTVVGYAINNVVVVFDRIREIILKTRLESFEQIVNIAINQTLSRQLNTSLTTLFPLLFIYFFGGETLKYFSLALIVGIIAGLYSSIFLAGPILVSWQKRMRGR